MARVESVERFVMVIKEADREIAEQTIDRELSQLGVEIVIGGASRHESEIAALDYLAPDIESGSIDIILIHDGARPLISSTLIRELINSAVRHGGVFPGLEVDEGVRFLNRDGTLNPTPPAKKMIRAQTPQVFQAAPLLLAYRQSMQDGFIGTDTASCFQQYHAGALQFEPGDPRNLKITYAEDLFAAEEILRTSHFRIE